MSSYDSLATSYDALMADGSYLKRANFLDKLFQKSKFPIQTVLDLACGTGTISCLLAERGYDVIATDGSVEMLTEAAAKAAALESSAPLFLHQAMPRLQLQQPVDAAISTFDSLNYLTREADIRETFCRVYRWLKPGGIFVFDVNSPYKFQRMNCQMYMDETEDSYCVWRTFYSQRTRICTYQVDLFQLTDNGTWDRSFEEHRERAWNEDQLRSFLEEAGFNRIKISGDLTLRAPKVNEDRWIFRAEKK